MANEFLSISMGAADVAVVTESGETLTGAIGAIRTDEVGQPICFDLYERKSQGQDAWTQHRLIPWAQVYQIRWES